MAGNSNMSSMVDVLKELYGDLGPPEKPIDPSELEELLYSYELKNWEENSYSLKNLIYKKNPFLSLAPKDTSNGAYIPVPFPTKPSK